MLLWLARACGHWHRYLELALPLHADTSSHTARFAGIGQGIVTLLRVLMMAGTLHTCSGASVWACARDGFQLSQPFAPWPYEGTGSTQ
eukprot:943182-Lingulodinium_polyedra.AAC.1